MKNFWFLLLFGVNALQTTTEAAQFTTLKHENSTEKPDNKPENPNENKFTTKSPGKGT